MIKDYFDFNVDEPQMALRYDVKKELLARSHGLDAILDNILLVTNQQLNELIKTEYTSKDLEQTLKSEQTSILNVRNASINIENHLKSAIHTVKETEPSLSIITSYAESDKIGSLNIMLKSYDKIIKLQEQYNDAKESANFIELENVWNEIKKYKTSFQSRNINIIKFSDYELTTRRKGEIYKQCLDKILLDFNPIILVNLIVATIPTAKNYKNTFATQLINRSDSCLTGVLKILNEIDKIFLFMETSNSEDSLWKRLKDIKESKEVKEFYDSLPKRLNEKFNPSEFLNFSDVYKYLPQDTLDNVIHNYQIEQAFSNINNLDRNITALKEIGKYRNQFAKRCVDIASEVIIENFRNIKRRTWINGRLSEIAKVFGGNPSLMNLKTPINDNSDLMLSVAKAAGVFREIGSASDFCDAFPLLIIPYCQNLFPQKLRKVVEANPGGKLDLELLTIARDELFA